MRKSIYLAAIAAISLTACSGDQDQIFDQSAADRLEQYKQGYAEILAADGGLWSMEYFSNPDEEGYVFVMKFGNDGSVNISANHKWIGGTFQSERSSWRMIADNGPVLSFSSYNKLFHIFADPADITGPDQPTGENGPIDETGFGHEGDYEFQVMNVSDDKQTVRLLGKKRMHNIYLRKLDPATDVEKYLDDVKNVTDFIVPYFGFYNLISADGEPFIVRNLDNQIPSVYPKNGDEVSQTRSGNVIFTLSGFRFMDSLEVPRADESQEPLVLDSFTFQEDGSFATPDGDRLIGPTSIEALMMETFDYCWYVDLDKLKGQFVQLFANLEAGIKEAYPTRSIESVYFGYDVYEGETLKTLNVKISGTRAATFYLDVKTAEDNNFSYNILASNSQAATLSKRIPQLPVFADEMAKFSFSLSNDNIIAPVVVTMTDNIQNANQITVEIR